MCVAAQIVLYSKRKGKWCKEPQSLLKPRNIQTITTLVQEMTILNLLQSVNRNTEQDGKVGRSTVVKLTATIAHTLQRRTCQVDLVF